MGNVMSPKVDVTEWVGRFVDARSAPQNKMILWGHTLFLTCLKNCMQWLIYLTGVIFDCCRPSLVVLSFICLLKWQRDF